MAGSIDSSDFPDLIARLRDALMPGEAVSGQLAEQPTPNRPSDEEINEKYARGEIRIVTEQARYPLESITDLLKSGSYKLDPDYQRRHRWDVAQRSRLIESFIMNVPVPPVFLYEWDYSQYEVMDGLQRMTAVREFYMDAFALTGLEYWKELEGLKYSQLPSRIKAGINRRYLSSIVLLKETSHGDEDPDVLKRFVFGRINTGGVHLSPQELRNALYDGPMNRLCKELSTSPILRRLWGIPVNVESLVEQSMAAERLDGEGEVDDGDIDSVAIPRAWRDMTDVELVLRFFANRQRLISYRDNIRDYLDAYLQAANKFDSDMIEDLRDLFLNTIAFADAIFGEFAFRRIRGSNWGNVPSRSIYDALMNVLSRLLPDQERLIARREDVVSGLSEFYSENSQVFNLRGQTRSDFMRREILLESYLRSFLESE